MASLNKRTCRGYTYWAIVESKRINGKPRPVVLEYLGTVNNLLKRLKNQYSVKVRSYSHGACACLLDIANELNIVQIINKHVPNKQFRNGLTVGGSLLLAALGRVCHPTSKDNWYEGWARHSSLSYILSKNLKKIDSQHFWDQMHELPEQKISLIEQEIIKNVLSIENIKLETLLCDTTNFFTYINTTNVRCHIAKRGKNKQKRADLRQFGLLLLVSRHHSIPILHKVYTGNLQDKTVFKQEFSKILNRFESIAGSKENITIVFDQGNNSKIILKNVYNNIKFVGALSPYQHKSLIQEANIRIKNNTVNVNNKVVPYYRTKKVIWGINVTVIVYISKKLQDGQIRGLEKDLSKVYKKLSELKQNISFPTKRGKRRTVDSLNKRLSSILKSHKSEKLIEYSLTSGVEDSFNLDFNINYQELEKLKDEWFGRRIIITNRHDWETKEIISAYWGQCDVEYAFKNMKNPYHLSIRPQYHWTDQKIQVHSFVCLIGFLLSMVLYKRTKEKINFKGCPHTLLEKLANIRLSAIIEKKKEKNKGRLRVKYQLEEMENDLKKLAQKLNIERDDYKINIPISVYK